MESDLFNGALPFPVNFTTIAIGLVILLALIAFVRGDLYRAALSALCILCRSGDRDLGIYLSATDGRGIFSRPDS